MLSVYISIHPSIHPSIHVCVRLCMRVSERTWITTQEEFGEHFTWALTSMSEARSSRCCPSSTRATCCLQAFFSEVSLLLVFVKSLGLRLTARGQHGVRRRFEKLRLIFLPLHLYLPFTMPPPSRTRTRAHTHRHSHAHTHMHTHTRTRTQQS
jgi:hypothetical protein